MKISRNNFGTWWHQVSNTNLNKLMPPPMIFNGQKILVDKYKIHAYFDRANYARFPAIHDGLIVELEDAIKNEVIAGYKFIRRNAAPIDLSNKAQIRQLHMPFVIYPHPHIDKDKGKQNALLELLKKLEKLLSPTSVMDDSSLYLSPSDLKLSKHLYFRQASINNVYTPAFDKEAKSLADAGGSSELFEYLCKGLQSLEQKSGLPAPAMKPGKGR